MRVWWYLFIIGIQLLLPKKNFLEGGKGGMGVCGENEKSNFPHKHLFISYSNKLYSVI